MISFSHLGQYGQLGNQLFQIAATIGLAKRQGLSYVFPKWKYSEYFKNKIPQSDSIGFDYQVQEPHFHYNNLLFDQGKNIDLIGYFQSEKYWEEIKDQIKLQFIWDPTFLESVSSKLKTDWRKTAAIHVRRGDYVGNDNYYQLDKEYYRGAINMLTERNLRYLVFSNDIDYCRQMFCPAEGFPEDFTFIRNSEIEDLCLMSLCDNFIIANSSFSWWAAWLGEKPGKQIVAPFNWNAGELLKKANDKDIVPSRWLKFNPNSFKPWETPLIDLSDVTFTIPVKYDHEDRKENLDLCIRFLLGHFKTNIIVFEQDHEPHFNYLMEFPGVEYKFIPETVSFHRTKLLNDMAKMAKTEYVANWDCDIFIHPVQIFSAVSQLREGQCSGIFPYDGRFLRASRSYYRHLYDTLDVGIFNGVTFHKNEMHHEESFGGAIIWNKEDFMAGGMENEFFIHYGPEDKERVARFRKLGYKVERQPGALFHLNHYVGNNGSKGHEYLETNNLEFNKVSSMSKEELALYVNTWPWPKQTFDTAEAHSSLYNIPFDKAYCITLERRKEDRLPSAQAEFKKVGFKDIEYFRAVDGQQLNLTHFDKNITPGMIGCFESHKAILKYAFMKDLDCIIVFEDDLSFASGFNEFFNVAYQSIPEDWHFCYLGWKEYGEYTDGQEVNKYWMVPKAVWGTQGYMIRTKEAIEKIFKALDKMETQVDMQLASFLKTSGLNYYKLFPCVVRQKHDELGTDVQIRSKNQIIQ